MQTHSVFGFKTYTDVIRGQKVEARFVKFLGKIQKKASLPAYYWICHPVFSDWLSRDIDAIRASGVKLKGNPVQSYEEHGDSLLKAGKHREALLQYGKAAAILQGEKAAGGVNVKMGHASLDHGELFNAMHYFKEALRLSYRAGQDAYFGLGKINAIIGQPDSAIGCFSSAIQEAETKLAQSSSEKLKTFLSSAHECRGDVHFARKDYAEAQKDYEQARTYDGLRNNLHVKLGNVLFELGQRDEAWTQFYLALGNDKNLPGAHIGIGRYRIFWKNFIGAIASLTEALRLDPASAQAYFYKGIAYLELRKYDEAEFNFSRAIKHEPKMAEAYFKRGLARQQLGNNSQANEDFAAYFKLLGQRPVAEEIATGTA